jgi:hypothetical protein
MSRSWSLALCFVIAGVALGAEQAARRPLADGLFLQGLDGRLVHDDVNDVWRFDLTVDVNTPRAQVPAGTGFPLLPSATLAGMIDDLRDRVLPLYRLSATVTQYEGRNYLFPRYHLPLSRFKESNEAQQESEGKAAVTETEPNTALPIPGEIAEKLKSRRVLRGPQRATGASEQAPSRMLLDAVGFIEQRNGRAVFVPDALGLDVSTAEYRLLPDAALEQAQRQQAAAPDRVRFSVTGQVSEFEGKQYLLLLRASRAYNFGDFNG